MNKLTKFLFAISLTAPLLFACSKGNKGTPGVLLEQHQIELKPGEDKEIELASGISFGTLKFDSSDKYIADYSSGKIHGISEGRAVITVTDTATNIYDICKVVVRYGPLEPLNALDVPTIAHRGYHVTAVENTRDAFIEAGRRNFYGIETDIRLTKDGYWICNHDASIKGMNKPIAECTLEEIMRIDLSIGNGGIVRVCKFEEYIEICSIYNKHPIIEFKISPTKQKLDDVFKVLEKYDVTNEVVFISFNRDVLNSVDKIKQQKSYKYDIQLLVNASTWDEVPSSINISCDKQFVTAEMINNCKAKGQYVATWTVDILETAESLIQMGAKYITTNIFECDPKYVDNALFD